MASQGKGSDSHVRLSSVAIDGQELVVLSSPTGPGSAVDMLTASERAVADLVLAGRSTRDIAAHRGTAERTVSNQIQSIYRKLGVRSREELALLLLAGLGSPSC